MGYRNSGLINKYRLQIVYLFILGIFLYFSSIHAQEKIIFDTDIGGDADDLGALAMLHNLADAGECEILAIICVARDRFAVPGIDAINHFYNRPDIPVGIIRDSVLREVDWRYNRPIAEQLPHDLTSEEAPSAVRLYRQVLTKQDDKSIKIVTVGYLTNIYNLMKSGPDDISPLSGKELIGKKVKEFTIMGGQYPEGTRYNIKNDPKAAAYVFENLNVPIVFTGWEVGRYIKTGLGIKQLDTIHPLYIGYDYYYKNAPWEVNATWLDEDEKGKMRSKPSFDQTAVLYAVRGGVGKYWELVKDGYCQVDTVTGFNRWISGDKTNQAYLRVIAPNEEIAEVIENIMLGKME